MRVTKCYQEKWSVSSSNEHIIFNIIISLNLLKLFRDGERYIISKNYICEGWIYWCQNREQMLGKIIYWFMFMIMGEIIIILEKGILHSLMQYSSDNPSGVNIHLNRNWSQSKEKMLRPALLLARSASYHLLIGPY